MKKIIGVFAALMVALAMTGVGFACWSQTIYIEGSVETGEVCVGFVDTDCYDVEDKEVGDVSCDLEDWKCYTEEHGDAYETLEITLSNVYPSYLAYCDITIVNCGTIPVNLVDFDIDAVSDPDGLLDFVDWWIEDYSWPDCPQIDPCDEVTVTIGIHIIQWVDFNEDEIEDPEEICPEGATATFEGYLEFCQWNETCVDGD